MREEPVNMLTRSSALIAAVFALSLIGIQLTSAIEQHYAESGPNGSLLLIDRELDLMGNDKLLTYLTRVGPNMRASTDYHDFKDIQIDEALLAWKLMHKQAQDFSQDQVRFYKPKITSLLLAANVSQSCLESVEFTLDSIKRLDSWAVQMYNSMGSFPPVGLLSGQLTDSGSYLGCINLVRPVYNGNSSSDSPWRKSSGHTSYCTIALRPIVPKRPEFHMVFNKLDKRLIEQFGESDVFHTLAQNSQFFHYLYMKTGVCVPSECSPEDIQRVVGLINRRLVLAQGPVRCFTRVSAKQNLSADIREEYQNEPNLVRIDVGLNSKQLVALVLISSFFALVLVVTLWHLASILMKSQDCLEQDEKEFDNIHAQVLTIVDGCDKRNTFKHFAFDYLSLITNGREFLNISMKNHEIKCLHGLRVFTMIWIIIAHTLQYNEWSGFTQVFEVIPTLQSIVLQPIFNANYTIDNFFFMSGLLASYTAWYSGKGTSLNFSFTTSLVGRYLRLTPQVLLISMFYMLLPLLSHGPNWYGMTQEEANFCQKNWWVNLLHIQSFYRKGEICNLVGWWISVDMFFYIIAIGLILLILNAKIRRALLITSIIVGLSISVTAYLHYTGGFTPNNLGVVPQVDEVWTNYVLNFVWTPYPHALPFFYGLWIGYVLANNMWLSGVRKWMRTIWTASTICLIVVNLSSHIWMGGYVDIGEQYVSTLYNLICPILWCVSFSWIVIACHYGCASPLLNDLLSNRPIVLMSKASFIIYLSHMLIIRTYFGLQNSLLSVSIFAMTYMIIGNIVFSTLLGVFLCISFEGPFIKLQRAIVRRLKDLSANTKIHSSKEADYGGTISSNTNESKVVLKMFPTNNPLLK